MSEPRKRTDAEVWHALEKLTADVELERIGALSDEDLDGELRAAGVDPSEAAHVGPAVAAATPKPVPTPHVPATLEPAPTPAPRKARWVGWIAAAAVAALVAGVLAKRPEIAGSPRPGGGEPDSETAARRRQAGKLRDDAFGACDQGLWGSCEEKLNAARALDPEGEKQPRVLAARQSVYDAEHADAGGKPEKPRMP